MTVKGPVKKRQPDEMSHRGAAEVNFVGKGSFFRLVPKCPPAMCILGFFFPGLPRNFHHTIRTLSGGGRQVLLRCCWH